jgi:hypothetical protein
LSLFTISLSSIVNFDTAFEQAVDSKHHSLIFYWLWFCFTFFIDFLYNFFYLRSLFASNIKSTISGVLHFFIFCFLHYQKDIPFKFFEQIEVLIVALCEVFYKSYFGIRF